MKQTKSKDGTSIQYHSWGDGAQTVIFIHGWMASSAIFDRVLAELPKLDVRILVPDLRGAGGSEEAQTSYEIDRYVEDVEAVIAASGAERVTLVGHSMGGQIAQVTAARNSDKVDRLALICPVPASGIPLPEEAAGLFSTSGQDREKQAAILGMACLQLDDEIKTEMLNDAAKISAKCIADSFAAWSAGGFQDELGGITATTLVVGTDDPFLPPDFLDAAVVQPIPNASFHHIPGPGHYPQVEATEASAKVLADFLA
ncbi:MAG: alpha/beta hydrolase [Myxococcota bacterium]|nr:alpha/beta hydrolase [Myxococcota bacterium]MEC9441391.1 alpha/beta hydrolase [Myxococcota bacterium]